MKTAALLAALSVLAISASARAEAPADRVSLSVGPRLLVIPAAGYDPYSTNDVLAQFAISGGVTLFHSGTASMIASLEWDFGGKSASARGQDASLFVHRLAGSLETRWQPVSRLYFSAKLAPGALRLLGSISDPVQSSPLLARAWTWNLEATGGAGLLLGRTARAQFWLTGEIGYAFAGEAQMAFAHAATEDDPRNYGTTMLPPLKLAGGVGKLGVAVSF
jgi:hypothetical protein